MDIIKKLAEELTLKEEHIAKAVEMLDEGNTVPFIARYRKEVTGSMDDETLRTLPLHRPILRRPRGKGSVYLYHV
jgi:uncharacterized protein